MDVDTNFQAFQHGTEPTACYMNIQINRLCNHNQPDLESRHLTEPEAEIDKARNNILCRIMKSCSIKIRFGVIQEAFEVIAGHEIYGPKLQNKWLSAVTYVAAMKEAHLFSPEHADVVDVKKFNSAMAKSRKWGNSMTLFNGTNATNVWHVTYDRVHFYMVSELCQQVQYPAKLDIAWCQEVYHSEIGILRWTRSATEAGFLDEVVDGVFD